MCVSGSSLSHCLNSAAVASLPCRAVLCVVAYFGGQRLGLGQFGSALYASWSLVGGLVAPLFVRRSCDWARIATGCSLSSTLARVACRCRAASSWSSTGAIPTSLYRHVVGVVFHTGRTALRA